MATANVEAQLSKHRGRRAYLLLVSGAGLALTLMGLARLPDSEQLPVFLLLLALAVLAQFAATGAEVTFEVSTAVSLATVPFFGPAAATVVATAANVSIWLIKRSRSGEAAASEWKGSLEQLTFNMGMSSLSVYAAGQIYLLTTMLLGGSEPWVQGVAWLLAAIVGDQLNVWLLAGILYLQQNVPPLAFWRSNRWAMPINVVVLAAGGGILATAVQQFNALGVAIFFLPVFLSAYAFRLYVQRTRAHMEKLEEIIADRTQELVEANQSLEELNKQKDAFLAVLTHDMRSPLTNIHGYASLLRDYDDVEPSQRKHMAEVILRNERALLEIVNNILDIEHLESGGPVMLERQNFDLGDLIREMVESARAQAQEKQISVEYETGEKPIFVHADRPKVGRILQNLVSNAIKYTPENGCIDVKASMNGRYVTIDVRDTGYGIPANELPHIFNRYSRVAKHKHKAVGTGLGLAIVKSLIEAHEGEIEVVSEEGVGSTFRVKIPA